MRIENIPTRLLVWHEQTDPHKLLHIRNAVEDDAPLPPIEAMAIGHRFLVLDGAHRAQAHHESHLPHIRARLHTLPLTAEVPGWSHAIPLDAAIRLARLALPAGNRGQADIVINGVRRHLGTTSRRLRDQYLFSHKIARIAYAHGITPLEPDSCVEHAHDSIVMTWQPPNLGDLWAMANDMGPLPATVTRFAPLLAHGSVNTSTMTPVIPAA
ncbi:hypothetical protein FYJ43_00675 [Cutibacterium sp. WCA-380-WT-3A]|uniref:ParB/Sulfiredoxin domain-containing protein n=1 Tax=Cutibacterium porci TaxID=2605781 RepID=A0A7K0J3U3_9ACTN|nr:hypothetical protein [Cutibacterium porci]